MKTIIAIILTIFALAACQAVPETERSESDEVKNVLIDFMDALDTVERAEVAKFSTPDSPMLSHIDELATILASLEGDISPIRVWIDSDAALAASSSSVSVSIDGKVLEGYLIFGLKSDVNLGWRVHFVDIENEATIDEVISDFNQEI